MSIVGDHPLGGVRFDLERTAAPPWVYTGYVFTPDAQHALCVTVDATGMVTVNDEGGLPDNLVQRAKLLLRTAHKHAAAQGEGRAPPKRIHRWRAG